MDKEQIDNSKKMRKDMIDWQTQYISLQEATIDLVDEHFPKGKCKERGQALVLYTEMLIKTIDLIQSLNPKGDTNDR